MRGYNHSKPTFQILKLPPALIVLCKKTFCNELFLPGTFNEYTQYGTTYNIPNVQTSGLIDLIGLGADSVKNKRALQAAHRSFPMNSNRVVKYRIMLQKSLGK